jgi:hypothetical protein
MGGELKILSKPSIAYSYQGLFNYVTSGQIQSGKMVH